MISVQHHHHPSISPPKHFHFTTVAISIFPISIHPSKRLRLLFLPSDSAHHNHLLLLPSSDLHHLLVKVTNIQHEAKLFDCNLIAVSMTEAFICLSNTFPVSFFAACVKNTPNAVLLTTRKGRARARRFDFMKTLLSCFTLYFIVFAVDVIFFGHAIPMLLFAVLQQKSV